MIDDTCYSIPCKSGEEARLLHDLLSSESATEFLRSLIFTDSKRPLTIDVLRRISLVELARELGRLQELQQFIYADPTIMQPELQMPLLLEPKEDYQTSDATNTLPIATDL